MTDCRAVTAFGPPRRGHDARWIRAATARSRFIRSTPIGELPCRCSSSGVQAVSSRRGRLRRGWHVIARDLDCLGARLHPQLGEDGETRWAVLVATDNRLAMAALRSPSDTNARISDSRRVRPSGLLRVDARWPRRMARSSPPMASDTARMPHQLSSTWRGAIELRSPARVRRPPIWVTAHRNLGSDPDSRSMLRPHASVQSTTSGRERHVPLSDRKRVSRRS